MRGWIDAKIRELAAVLRRLPADRQDAFTADVLETPAPDRFPGDRRTGAGDTLRAGEAGARAEIRRLSRR